MRVFTTLAVILLLQACKHPLAIVGEGDIVDANNSGHGCTHEQFQAQDTACSENEVSGNYFVNYKAEPRPGWRFVRWEGPCSHQSDFQYCRIDSEEDWVSWMDETYPDDVIPPSTAVFQPITGETGYLVAGTAVAGVAYETTTLQGVTGIDGSFQYEEGETVRFTIGDTLLGEVTGQVQVTPFGLAGSAVLTGIKINWALVGEDAPFRTVINIAVLLQGLDHDGKPENGIEIRQGVAALFRGVSLDVSQHWETFQNESTLRHALGQANRQRRFSEVHGIVKPPAALEHLYEALEIDARTVGISLLQIEDGDGNLERTERFQYDASGNMTWHDDGTPDAFESWQYDANGNLIRYERNAEKYIAVGGDRIVETWQYDTNGNVTRKERDYDADGTLEEIFTWHYQYNTYGNVTRIEDEAWQYDTRGHVIRKEHYDDANGTPDHIETWQYNAKGDLTRAEVDYDADGTPDAFESWQYDTNGNLTRHESDRGWYELKTWQYDANGNVTQTTEKWDRGRYGMGESIGTWQYDNNGNPTRAEEDNDGDGMPNHVKTWQYDANGNLTEFIEEDNDGDGMPNHVETWQYDANGNLTEFIEEDDGGDGATVKFKRWYYDTDGNVTLLVVGENYTAGVVIAGNDGPGYDGGELFSNGVSLPESAINDIAFITYVDGWSQQPPNENGRDQGQIFGTGGTVRLTTDTLSQSITAGITGQLTGIQIQWNAAIPIRAPPLNFSIVAGGNPPTGDTLYSEQLVFDSIEDSDLFTWDLTDANLYFEAGDPFTFTLSTQGEGIPNRVGNDRYEYDTNGNITRAEEDNDGDGMPNHVETWQYDANGNLTQFLEEEDNDDDGMIDGATIYQFKATGWGHLFSNAPVWPHGDWPPLKPKPDPG